MKESVLCKVTKCRIENKNSFRFVVKKLNLSKSATNNVAAGLKKLSPCDVFPQFVCVFLLFTKSLFDFVKVYMQIKKMIFFLQKFTNWFTFAKQQKRNGYLFFLL